MASTLLEQTRSAHEKVERLEASIIQDMLMRPKTQRGKIEQDHRTLKRLEEIVATNLWLAKTYDDDDGSRKEELASMAPGSLDRCFEAFDQKLNDIRGYYKKFPDLTTNSDMMDLENVSVSVIFSGEEANGRFLDLHELHDKYRNLRNVPPMDYMEFLENFHVFERIPSSTQQSFFYKRYLQDLLAYLLDFFSRALPLDDVSLLLDRALKQYEASLGAAQTESTPMDTDAPASETTSHNPLFCPPCQKQFAKDTVFNSHLNGKKHKKAAAAFATQNAEAAKTGDSTPLLERKIAVIAEYLSDVIQNTKKNVEKRQSMTLEEKEANLDLDGVEYEEVVEDEDESGDEEDEKIWNPKGLPLDVTGKPIPYWLWKLHGLGVEYQCEICGNYSYWGHYAFEKHFQEWRHQHAMKILGIPNTKHFNNVTTIQEAIALHQKLKQDQAKNTFRADLEEEYEDREGNVIPRKTYEDMLRQGLL